MRRTLALLALASSTLAQQCYYPAGNPSNDVPCSSSGGTCCSSKDRCLSNGLCAIDSSGSDKAIQFARGSCTDANWGSSCFQQCSKMSYPGSLWTNIANVFICSGTSSSSSSYCCETALNQGQGCCSGTTFPLAAGTPIGAAPKPSTTAAAKPSNHVLIQQASSSTTATSAAVVTTVSSSSSSVTSHATVYSSSTALIMSGNSTISSTAAGTGTGKPSATGGSGSGATGSPIGPANPSATGTANKAGQAGFGLLIAAAGAVLLL